MVLDKMEAFKALEHFDVRIARSAYVDSPEAAIAFAQRRDAPDPRGVPIVLRAVSGSGLSRSTFASERALDRDEAIRRAYERIAAESPSVHGLLAQEATEPGTDILITGETGEASVKTIALHGNDNVVERMVPLGDAGAAELAENFRSYHHRLSRASSERMLEHLLEKLSTFFEQTPATDFQLAVRLHENGYTVLDVSMTSPRPLRLKERLDPRAHDRKGDDFHPAGRQ